MERSRRAVEGIAVAVDAEDGAEEDCQKSDGEEEKSDGEEGIKEEGKQGNVTAEEIADERIRPETDRDRPYRKREGKPKLLLLLDEREEDSAPLPLE
jgi:hypothetical protein